ncbi:membrane protein implicated in regulation of membrane protease activity [Deinobacterium chartae]|uniref:Membrane protein implicated in regulation of membrane protease activity n=1 Tax=Deinobacterium chartae TaxID=521158 RepID=A0A841I068_9DEIO|nr:NfeD family protein [Deinobacterium chartae]MBB6098354.1 membrane protein implicated in regulation of membrane protease activity [Deinobacterium chartae]
MLYWICLLSGGVTLLLSLLGSRFGSRPGPVDAGGELHLEMPPRDPDDRTLWARLRPALFAVTFFGLGGLIAEFMGLSESGRMIFATISGGSVGITVACLFRYVRRQESGTLEEELVGRSATVLVPPRPGRPGRVRVVVAGQASEVWAEGDSTLEVGTPVIVIGRDRDRVRIKRWEGGSR